MFEFLLDIIGNIVLELLAYKITQWVETIASIIKEGEDDEKQHQDEATDTQDEIE